MTSLLAIVIDAAKDNLHSWLLAASLPPALYYLTKKRKQRWTQKLMMKWVTNRARKRANKGKGMSNGLAILLFVLGIIGICALLVWLLGGAWAVFIGLLLVIGVAGAVRKD